MTDGMTQIKFTIKSDVVSMFKAKCASNGVSMTSVVRKWMTGRQPGRFTEFAISSRPERRKGVVFIISLLNEILKMEESYRDSIPEPFAQRYESSDNTCDYLAEAIVCLEEAFAP